MIWLDRGYYADTNCYLYRFDNLDDCEIIADISFESDEMYEDCMFYVLKENGKYYFFGASRNGSWRGYEITKRYAEELTDYSEERIVAHFKYLDKKMFWKSPYDGGLK